MSMSNHIWQMVPRGIAVFLLKSFIFLETGKNCHSVVFTVLQIRIKVESRGKCGRVVGSSGHIPALT